MRLHDTKDLMSGAKLVDTAQIDAAPKNVGAGIAVDADIADYGSPIRGQPYDEPLVRWKLGPDAMRLGAEHVQPGMVSNEDPLLLDPESRRDDVLEPLV